MIEIRMRRTATEMLRIELIRRICSKRKTATIANNMITVMACNHETIRITCHSNIAIWTAAHSILSKIVIPKKMFIKNLSKNKLRK